MPGGEFFAPVVISSILYFHPDPCGNDPIRRAYFSDGWLNHQRLFCFGRKTGRLCRPDLWQWRADLNVLPPVGVVGSFFGPTNPGRLQLRGVSFFWGMDFLEGFLKSPRFSHELHDVFLIHLGFLVCSFCFFLFIGLHPFFSIKCKKKRRPSSTAIAGVNYWTCSRF